MQVLAFVGLLVLYYISRPLDKKRWILLGAMTLGMVIAISFFGSFFELTALDFQSALVIVVFLMLAPSVIYVFEKGFEWLWKVMDAHVIRKFFRRRKEKLA